MEHDPFCPSVRYRRAFEVCACDLLAEVREDERGKQFVSDEALMRIAGGIAKATPVDEATWRQSTYDTGYAAALRDAVEAVESQRSADPMWDGTNWNNALFCAVEAIEALGQITEPISDSDSA